MPRMTKELGCNPRGVHSAKKNKRVIGTILHLHYVFMLFVRDQRDQYYQSAM